MLIVQEDVNSADEEGIRVKEQAMLELATLLAETKQPQGIYVYTDLIILRTCQYIFYQIIAVLNLTL